MQNAKPMSEMLTEEFTKNYMEKLFYFCLKKTGSTEEAEDLASDVTLNILSAFKKGVVPESFSAWVWRVARNRYAAWAKQRHISNEKISGADIEEFELTDNFSLEGSLIEREEIELLRRELAFIARSYRDILLAYYVEDRSIKDIAASLSRPEGTVKSDLFRARKILKEGMNMARTFGIKSYKPEDIEFAASGTHDGKPWKATERKIPKNILIHACNNPCTIEDLSIELGIATPYMEEEVALLEKATLLKKLDDKYITNFFIVDKEAKLAEYAAMRKSSKERSEMIDTIISDILPEMRALGIAKNGMFDNDMKWWAVIHAVDFIIIQNVKGFHIYCPEMHTNGENWGFVGYESKESLIPERIGMGNNGSGNGNDMFWAYKIGDYDLWNRAGEMDSVAVLLLADLVRNVRTLSSLTTSEQSIWNEINGRFAHADENGNIIPDILVADTKAFEKIHSLITSHPLFPQVLANMQEAFDACVEILRARSHPAIADQLAYCASMEILDIRMMTVHDEVDAGRLILPENPKTSTIAMCLHLK